MIVLVTRITREPNILLEELVINKYEGRLLSERIAERICAGLAERIGFVLSSQLQ